MEDIDRNIKVVKVLKQVMDAIKQKVESDFKDMNITGVQGMLLGILAHYGGMKMSDLSDRMTLSNSTVSGIVDRLEKQGYVKRTRSKKDRRVVKVDITCQFKDEAKTHFKTVENKVGAIINKADPEEIDKIYEGLNILKQLMDREK